MSCDICENLKGFSVLHSCGLCTKCCYCDKFIFIINGYSLVGKAFQIDEIPLLNLTVLLQYLDVSENVLIKTDVDSFIIDTDKIDSIGWRTKNVKG